jgi:serine protease Do
MAVVVGAPAGPQRSPSVTAGVIAGLGEVVEVSGHPFYDLIATDATIGVRASGGPLVDRTGAVIGITTRVATLGDGDDRLGLVIPIDLARRVANEILTDGRVRWAWAGFAGSDLDPPTAAEYGAHMGTLVRQLAPGGPAERAGLEIQDVVTAVDGSPISTMHELTMLVRRHDPGDKVQLTVMRSGEVRVVDIELGVAPTDR